MVQRQGYGPFRKIARRRSPSRRWSPLQSPPATRSARSPERPRRSRIDARKRFAHPRAGKRDARMLVNLRRRCNPSDRASPTSPIVNPAFCKVVATLRAAPAMPLPFSTSTRSVDGRDRRQRHRIGRRSAPAAAAASICRNELRARRRVGNERVAVARQNRRRSVYGTWALTTALGRHSLIVRRQRDQLRVGEIGLHVLSEDRQQIAEMQERIDAVVLELVDERVEHLLLAHDAARIAAPIVREIACTPRPARR